VLLSIGMHGGLFRMRECVSAGKLGRSLTRLAGACPRHSIAPELGKCVDGWRHASVSVVMRLTSSPGGYLLPAILFASSAGNLVSMTPRSAVRQNQANKISAIL